MLGSYNFGTSDNIGTYVWAALPTQSCYIQFEAVSEGSLFQSATLIMDTTITLSDVILRTIFEKLETFNETVEYSDLRGT